MIRLTRRRLLLSAAAVGTVGAVAAGMTAGSHVLPLSADERLKQVIRTQLDYLQIPEEVLDAFIRDYKADPLFSRHREFGKSNYGVRSAVMRLRLSDGQQVAQRRERHIVAYFLQSTDFFREGSNPDRPLSYWRYWDPYRLGCANQFAKLA